MQLEELKHKLVGIQPELEKLGNALGIEKLGSEYEELQLKTSQPDFWNNAEQGTAILKRQGEVRGLLDGFEALEKLYKDAQDLVDIGIDMEDEEAYPLAEDCVNKLTKGIEELHLQTLLSGEYDSSNAILTFHAGAGGTEAQDWVSMLYRMYTQWIGSHGFSYKILDYLDGEEAGIKSASILVSGTNAYGYLKGESGVHRLVRVSPFDSSGRRHTSFASLEVMPEITADMNVNIRDEDIEMQMYRSSGAGGQKVNKTSSAVRLTHIPTGIVVSCQVERSHHQNREVAMNMLRSKLVEIKEREHLDRIEDIKGDQKEIAWGSQIRSYVFMPYTLVKDHRTGCETGNINAVMDGALDEFIHAYLAHSAKKGNEA